MLTKTPRKEGLRTSLSEEVLVSLCGSKMASSSTGGGGGGVNVCVAEMTAGLCSVLKHSSPGEGGEMRSERREEREARSEWRGGGRRADVKRREELGEVRREV